MLLELRGRHLRALGETSAHPFVVRISERLQLPEPARAREALLLRNVSEALPCGFRAYFLHEPVDSVAAPPDAYALAPAMHYLAEGDVVRVDPTRKSITVLYRRASPSNSFLVTERCDNFCVMCSQPPLSHDDSWLLEELRQVIPLVSRETSEIGITGGEPALLGTALVDLLDELKRNLPRTAVHILSNGRRFSDVEFARSLGRVGHPDLMVGIPLYSDLPEEHDYVVQARGAFNETVRGILNLKRYGVRVELRFVIQAGTYSRLPEFAHFVARNLLFIDHVALMGLELVGFAKANLEAVWVDPVDYQEELVAAVSALDAAGMLVSIYNHQLCVLDRRLHPYARKSISDWKNVYFAECDACARRSDCGGFFASSARRRSRGICALPAENSPTAR